MKQEATLLAQKLGHLKQLYHNSHCVQCDLMQQHLEKELTAVNAKLAALDNMIRTNNIAELSLTNLHQSAAILGLYVMV